MLRAGKTKIFTKVILPLSRPAIVAGTLLVVLETLNDFGVVKYFNVRVFSFAIFDAWYRLSSLQSALRLSGILMVIVFSIIVIEKLLRGKRQFNTSVKSSPLQREKLTKKKSILVISILSFIFAISFLIPVLEMIFNFIDTYKTTINIELLYIVINTLSITIFASLVVVVLAIMIANFNRTSKSKLKPLILKITNLGYAIPGAIIAVTVIVFFVDMDRSFKPLYSLLGFEKNLVLTTSLAILVFAYTLRFLTIAFNSVEASYDKIGTKYTEASYTLGKSKLRTLLKVDVPLIKDGLVGAFIIVFVDVIKELPLTLILRPGNYNTIATQIYTYASDEMIQEASGPSLVLIIISAIMIYILTNRKRGGSNVRRNK
jgi:iron(III) transport system permease protein